MHKENEKLKLSISMMVSNSIDTIEKCMKGLEPILQSIPSELIVVDTGGTDGSIEIARKYADIVVPFVWCNDFAKARNAGLEKASGEWFLFLDDDECFDDTTELTEFFISGEYRKYGSASYTVRSYLTPKHGSYEDARCTRLLQMTPHTRFYCPIHEYIDPCLGPEKPLEVIAHHYGYLYEDDEARRAHFRRNASLILKELERHPDDLRLTAQMCQEYNSVKEYSKSQELCERVIRDFQSDNPRQRAYAGWLVYNSVKLELAQQDKTRAYERAQEYFKLDWLNSITGNNLCYYMSLLGFEKAEYEKCLYYTDIYEKTYDHLKQEVQKQRNQVILTQQETITEVSLFWILMARARAAIRLEQYEVAKPALRKLMKLECQMLHVEMVKDILKYLRIEKDKRFVKEVLCYLVGEEQAKQILLHALDSLSLTEENCELLYIISTVFYEMQKVSPCDVMLARIEKNDELLGSALDCYLKSVENLPDMSLCAWDILLEKGMNVTPYISCRDIEQWIPQVNQFASNVEPELLEKVLLVLRNASDDFAVRYFKMRCLDRKMRNWNDAEAPGNIWRLLKEYTDVVLQVYAAIYSEKVLQQGWEVFLPSDARFALEVKRIQEKDTGDRLEYAKRMRSTVDIYPEMSEFVKALLINVKEQAKQERQDQDRNEFQMLAEQIKGSIRQMIAANQPEAALQTIQQLKKLIPEDEEIERLERELSRKG